MSGLTTDSGFEAIAGHLARRVGMDSGETGGLYGCRTERKLLVEPGTAEALKAAVAARLAVEQYVPGRRRTLIHSLYFDTPDFELYRRSLAADGDLTLKLRLRSYADAATPDRPDSARFLEAKVSATSAAGLRQKHKARLSLAEADLASVLGLPGAPATFTPAARKKFWQPLLDFMAADDVRPRLTVSYVREAYVDPAGQLRITFDEGYYASPIAGGMATPLGVPGGRIGDSRIVEIKFLTAMPEWLTKELVRLGLPPEGQSFSKFKTAVPLIFPAAAS